MKYIKKGLVLVVTILSLSFPLSLFSQAPPPPPADHGTSGNQAPGGGAPIGGGVLILMGLGAVYGARKYYQSSKEELEE